MGKKKSATKSKDIDVKKVFAPFLRKSTANDDKPDPKQLKKALKKVCQVLIPLQPERKLNRGRAGGLGARE